MSNHLYYNSNPPALNMPEVVDGNWIAFQGVVDPETSTPAELAAEGYYLFSHTQASCDPLTEDAVEGAYVITGTDATNSTVVTPKSLADVKTYAVEVLKEGLNGKLRIAADSVDFPLIRFIAEATLTQANRDPGVQAVFTQMGTLMTDYAATIASVNSATTVAEVVAIVRP